MIFNSTTNLVKNHRKRQKFTLIFDVIRGCFFPPSQSHSDGRYVYLAASTACTNNIPTDALSSLTNQVLNTGHSCRGFWTQPSGTVHMILGVDARCVFPYFLFGLTDILLAYGWRRSRWFFTSLPIASVAKIRSCVHFSIGSAILLVSSSQLSLFLMELAVHPPSVQNKSNWNLTGLRKTSRNSFQWLDFIISFYFHHIYFWSVMSIRHLANLRLN